MKMKIALGTALLVSVLIGLYAGSPGDRVPRELPDSPAGSALAGGQRAPERPAVLPEQSYSPAPDRDSNCDIVTHYLPGGDGTVTEAYSCEPVASQTRHPYESYSTETLASLAYSDSKAAETLGMRFRERDEPLAMSLMIRASALAGGDTEPLVRYFNAFPHPTSIDGVTVPATARTQFVLLSVMELLGKEPYDLSRWADRIREFSPDPERELAVLKGRAERIVEEMRQIQLEVTGETSLGG